MSEFTLGVIVGLIVGIAFGVCLISLMIVGGRRPPSPFSRIRRKEGENG